MPTVPDYGGLKVTPTAQPAAQFNGPTMSGAQMGARQMEDLGQAGMRAGSAMSAISLDVMQQANQVRVNDAMNKAMAARLKWTHDKDAGYTTLQGDAALNRPDGKALDEEYSEKLKTDLDGIAATLGNDAQKRVFAQQSDQMLTQFRGQVTEHVGREFKQYQLSTQAGTVEVAQQQMSLDWKNPDALAQGQGAIKAAIAETGRLRGWAPAEVVARQVETLSPAHAAVVHSAVQEGKLDYAKAYMDKVKAELTPQARVQLGEQLKQSDIAAQAMSAAGDIWGQQGPKADGQPVELDKLEAAARDRFKDDPQKVKATIGELRERAGAFNASEGERAAGNTNAVLLSYSKGAGMAQLRTMPEFIALPGKQQSDILQHVTDRQHMLWARSTEDRNRLEAEQAKRTFPAYLSYSDPAALAGMSRAQVQALQPVLGNQLTEHLVNKWDGLQTKEGKNAASIDQDDFNHTADQMGLKPFNAKSEDDKRQLGELKFRVEQLIDQAQGTKKAPLDRQEKQELMRQEMARQVSVSNWFGLSSSKLPVIQLTAEQAARVRVPDTDRGQIVEALRSMYGKNPQPQFEPTEDNIRRLYLRAQSPAARLIPDAR